MTRPAKSCHFLQNKKTIIIPARLLRSRNYRQRVSEAFMILLVFLVVCQSVTVHNLSIFIDQLAHSEQLDDAYNALAIDFIRCAIANYKRFQPHRDLTTFLRICLEKILSYLNREVTSDKYLVTVYQYPIWLFRTVQYICSKELDVDTVTRVLEKIYRILSDHRLEDRQYLIDLAETAQWEGYNSLTKATLMIGWDCIPIIGFLSLVFLFTIPFRGF